MSTTPTAAFIVRRRAGARPHGLRGGRACVAVMSVMSVLSALACGTAQAAPRALVPAESRIDFVVKEMGVPVQGSFQRFEATIAIDAQDPARSSAELRIAVGSLSTGTPEADAIAVDKDWLDKDHAPWAKFSARSFRDLGGGHFEARGQLELRNRPRELVLRFASTEQPGGRTLITSDFVIRRSEFGIGAGEWNEAGVVAEEIPVKVRLMLAAPGQAAR